MAGRVVVLLLGVLVCYCAFIECVRMVNPEKSETKINIIPASLEEELEEKLQVLTPQQGKEKEKSKAKSTPLSLSLSPKKTRRLTTLAGHKVPLIGNLTYWGEYFAYVGLGTPPQYVNLQVDTGMHVSFSFLSLFP